MGYKMTSPSQYPFRRENAKFFSQELIENVLFDFGHIWKPVRTKREIQLRKVASFIFSSSIGRLVAYISRKYSGLVVMTSFKTWKYINSHRACVRERLLCNEIVSFCVRHELENDDLGLFTFLAIVTEYARLAITHEQENLVDTVVNALTYCLTNKLPGGFVLLLDRMISFALNFNYPRNYVCDYDSETRFVSPISTDSMHTPKSEFQSPIIPKFQFSPSLYSTPPEEILIELKNRKIHRVLFRLKMTTDHATQTEIKSSHSASHLQSIVWRPEQTNFAEKVEFKNDNLDSTFEQVNFFSVETKDISVQTWTSDNEKESDVTHNEILQIGEKKNIQISKDEHCISKQILDLNVIIEKLKALERLQADDTIPSSSRFDTENLSNEKPENEKCECETIKVNTALQEESLMDQEPDTNIKTFVFDACSDWSQLKYSGEKCASDKDADSLDVSTDDQEHSSEINYSSDSQIGSLNSSVKTLDENELEN